MPDRRSRRRRGKEHKPDVMCRSKQRFGMYRWHIQAPIRELRMAIQDPGWRSGGSYQPLQSDISSTVFWYQLKPHAPFPVLPGPNEREVI